MKSCTYYSKNREKLLLYGKAYSKANSHKISPERLNKKRQTSKLWQLLNRKKKNEWQRKWMKANRNRMRAYRKKQRLKPTYRIATNLRRRISKLLSGSDVSYNTTQLIGCDRMQLMEHIQNQFRTGMNWSNYGLWHIDHILPCAMFDLSNASQAMICFNWQNLRPLWAEDNMKKGDRVENGQLPLSLPMPTRSRKPPIQKLPRTV